MRAVSRASFFVRKNAPPEASEETGGGRGEEKPKIVLFFRSIVFLFALRICPNSSFCPFPFHPEAPGKPTRSPFFVLKERSDAAFFARENVPRFVLVIFFGRKNGENRSENARFSSFSLISVQKYCFSCRPERAKSLPNAAFSPFRALDALFF